MSARYTSPQHRFPNGIRFMKIRQAFALSLAIGLASFTLGLSEESGNSRNPPAESGAEKPASAVARPTVDEARRQAALLHKALHSALQVVHDRYYRADQGRPIPADTLKDVFADLEEEHDVRLRWLVVEGQAMNVDHKPKTAFENEAVAALKAGKGAYEQTEKGIYRRAGAITLGNHCLKCHVPDRKNTKDRTAGLMIAIPVQEN
jgi:hypothetical protein